MLTELHWIARALPLRLAIMARPRSGDWLEDEVRNWRQHEVGMVISLLEQDEIVELGLQNETALCEQMGIELVRFPIPDRMIPEDRIAALNVAKMASLANCAVAIHCRAGIGRSSLMAAAIMAARGIEPSIALDGISEARRLRVPDTDIQLQWINSLNS